MSAMWGVHNDHPELRLLEPGFISIGWDDVGDLRAFGGDKEAVKAKLTASRPEAKAGAIPGWAGVLTRFANEMQQGDLVIYPYKPDSTLNFGRIDGDYFYDPGAPLHHHRRNVEWLKTGVPRAQFTKSARYEIGSAVTLFRVKNHEQEFRAFLNAAGPIPPAGATPADAVAVDVATASAEEEPSAERIEDYTRDFIIETLLKQLEGLHFEHFVAHLLEAMGYRTRVTQATGDGGF
jgi:restriction system protein